MSANTCLLHTSVSAQSAQSQVGRCRPVPATAPRLAGLEDATAHEVIHTTAYHLAVTAKLALTKPSNQTNGRATLRDIKFDIQNNDFDY